MAGFHRSLLQCFVLYMCISGSPSHRVMFALSLNSRGATSRKDSKRKWLFHLPQRLLNGSIKSSLMTTVMFFNPGVQVFHPEKSLRGVRQPALEGSDLISWHSCFSLDIAPIHRAGGRGSRHWLLPFPTPTPAPSLPLVRNRL